MKKLLIFLCLHCLYWQSAKTQDSFIPVFDNPSVDSMMAQFFGDSISLKSSPSNVEIVAFKPIAGGPCYTLLDDYSGFNRQSYLPQLEIAASALRATLPAAFQDNFKVYDFGFYLHSQHFNGFTYPEAFKTLKASLPNTPYVLFGKQSDSKDGIYSKFWVTVNLPDVTGNGCLPNMNEQATQLLQFTVDNEFKEQGGHTNDFAIAFIEGMKALTSFVTTAQQCCQANATTAPNCISCSNPKAIAAKLHSMGFSSVKIQNIGVNPTPYQHPDIEDHAKWLFTVGGRYVVEIGPDYKNLIDSLHKVNIDTLNLNGITVRVYITTDADVCTPLWDKIIGDAKNYDIIYWHHIHKGEVNELGDEYLFTGVFYKGAFPHLKGSKNDRAFTNLIAALGSAATDLLLQTVVNYITDDQIKSGDYWAAVKTVNFYDVGFSFISGFFGLDKQIGTVGTALAGATTYVLGAANYHYQKGNNYTYQWAMKDFGINFMQNYISSKVGGAVGKKFSQANFSFGAWCKIARWLNKRLGTMIPGCFVAGTLVATPEGRSPIELLQPDDWAMTDTTLSPHQFVKNIAQNLDYDNKNNELWASNTKVFETVAKNQTQADVLDIPLRNDYDHIEITPDTWKIVTFNVYKSDATLAEVKLLRPNAWFEAEQIHQVGNSTWLDISDMNLSGTAVAKSFAPTTLDTRSAAARQLLAQGYYPILSTFKHKSDEVLYLRFTNGDKLGTTAPHPFWSIDRDGWVAAKDLQKQERVKTSTGFVILDSSVIVPIPTQVYNLESWKVHNYEVGEHGVRVHNVCYDITDVFNALRNSTLFSKTFKSKDGTDVILSWNRLTPNSLITWGDRNKFKKILGIPEGANMEAHHLLPWTRMQDNPVVQAAGLDGFHLNMPQNGVALPPFRRNPAPNTINGVHASAPQYDDWVAYQLRQFELHNPGYTPDMAHGFIQMHLIPRLRTMTNEAWNAGGSLNDYFINRAQVYILRP